MPIEKSEDAEPWPKPPERWLSLLGFVIVAKADLLAASAFLLSLVSIVYQLSSWMRGPLPSIYAPDLVYVFFDHYANNTTVVRFAAPLSFVNVAPTGHDAIIRDVNLEVSAQGKVITSEDWLSFALVTRLDKKLQVTPKEPAHPFPIVGGGATSYMVSFAPGEQSCALAPSACNRGSYFVSDTQFLNGISEASALDLTISARVVGFKKALSVRCSIALGPAFRQYLAENEWFAAKCNPTGPG